MDSYIEDQTFEKIDGKTDPPVKGTYDHCTFLNCDLADAVFDGTLLENADLRSAYNYSIDPEANKIKKAKFSLAAVRGLLEKYDIEIE